MTSFRQFCRILAGVGLLALATSCRTPAPATARAQPWRGVHVLVGNDRQLARLQGQLPQLAALGANTIVLRAGYNFEFRAHPELRAAEFITQARAREFARAAHQLGVRVIPEFNCLGHQSWSSNTAPLLVQYPQFDETPGQYPGNQGIYCRSWCPLQPEVNAIVGALIDEQVAAFQADAVHVGMDEVFLIGDDHCPRCRGHDPAELFAKAVNDLHRHIVGKRKLEMLMWGDRLLDAKALGYGKWDASENGTARAVDLIPKDIVICDWHYRAYPTFPSVPFLLEKGFRVWPSGFQPLENTRQFSAFARAQRQQHPRVVGYLATVWGRSSSEALTQWPPVTEILTEWKDLP
jgi:hypothetical protein